MSSAGLPSGSVAVRQFKVVTVGDYAAGNPSLPKTSIPMLIPRQNLNHLPFGEERVHGSTAGHHRYGDVCENTPNREGDNSAGRLGHCWTGTVSIGARMSCPKQAPTSRMNSLAPMYFRDAHAALIVFDITSKVHAQ